MFTLTQDQQEKADKFMLDHSCTIGYDDLGFRHTGAIGGSITYSFTPTGLSVIQVISCVCGAEENLTDFDKW